MKETSKKAGCKQSYTNHCLRAICISSLNSEGFEVRDIMTESAHCSASSLKNYSKTSEKRKREMSSQLSKQLCYTSPSNPKSSAALAPPTTTSTTTTCPRSSPRHSLALAVHTHTHSPPQETVTIESSQGTTTTTTSDTHGISEYSFQRVSVQQQQKTLSNRENMHKFQFHNCEVHIYNK